MSKVLDAMKKAGLGEVDLERRVQAIDRGNLFPLAQGKMANEFVDLANALVNRAPATGGSVVVFASTTKGEGCSFVSYNCARYLALLFDRKVAWVDANFRSPRKKIASSSRNLRDLIANPDLLTDYGTDPELVLIGNGGDTSNSVELVTGAGYPRLVEKLRETFFFTIIDAPPILEGVETGHLAEEALGLVLVVKVKGLKFEVINHGLDRLKSQGVEILGTALNRRRFVLPDFIYRRL